MSTRPPSTPLVWLITGTSSGFGLELTKTVLERGDSVIATARSADKIKHLEGTNCKVLQLDITDTEEAIKELAKKAVSIWGRVDVLVNNAGFGAPGLVEESSATGFMKQFGPNFFGVINVTNAFLPYMRAARSGTVVVVGSRHAWRTNNPGTAAYNSSKAAVHAYAETLSVEVAQFNIRVLIAQPGAHRTNAIESSRANNITRELIPDYEPMRKAGVARYQAQVNKQPGDPVKAMKALADVVRGEGLAAGRPMPLWLLLGVDSEQDLRDSIDKRLQNLEEWKDVSRYCAIDSPDIVLV